MVCGSVLLHFVNLSAVEMKTKMLAYISSINGNQVLHFLDSFVRRQWCSVRMVNVVKFYHIWSLNPCFGFSRQHQTSYRGQIQCVIWKRIFIFSIMHSRSTWKGFTFEIILWIVICQRFYCQHVLGKANVFLNFPPLMLKVRGWNNSQTVGYSLAFW